MTTRPLTQRQKEILGYLVSNARLRYPTVRQVAKHFGLSPSTVQFHIAAIKAKGHIEQKNSIA